MEIHFLSMQKGVVPNSLLNIIAFHHLVHFLIIQIYFIANGLQNSNYITVSMEAWVLHKMEMNDMGMNMNIQDERSMSVQSRSESTSGTNGSLSDSWIVTELAGASMPFLLHRRGYMLSSFLHTKGRLKQTKTRTDSVTASSCSYGLQLVKSVHQLSVHALSSDSWRSAGAWLYHQAHCQGMKVCLNISVVQATYCSYR